MKILGIETSCDETAAAVVEDGRRLLSSVVASSVDLHAAYGGVVPEIAARSHIESITPVINQALADAKADWSDIDAIAVTVGPGLIGSLLIGIMTARSLAIAKDKPLIPVNHVQAHVYAAFLADEQPKFPLLALIVSGGHTQLVLFENHQNYRLLGQTRDDAVGEAFDKVGKLLGLPYPGGPAVGKLAKYGNSTSVKLPSARLGDYDFSFSGPKTAVLRAAQALAGKDYTFPSSKLAGSLSEAQKANLAASFEASAIESLKKTTENAIEEYAPAGLVVAGGVAASSALRASLSDLPCPVIFPDLKLCTDNAAMIAALAFYNQTPADPYKLSPNPALSM